MCFADRAVYHFEAFGKELGEDNSVYRAFAATLGNCGWSLSSSHLLLQWDGVNCGVWLQVARDRFLEYVDSSQFGSRSFLAFMEEGLRKNGVVDLNSVVGDAKQRAIERNGIFILQQRAEIRTRLLQAAQAGALTYGSDLLQDFTDGPEAESPTSRELRESRRCGRDDSW